MKTVLKLVTAFLLLFMTLSATAVPPGATVEFNKNSMGPVTFSGEIHAKQKLDCQACHSKIFSMNLKTKITFADHVAGKSNCFTCHNGKFAFKPEENCNRCHIMKN